MTNKVYKVYTRRRDGDWEERRSSFHEPNIRGWDDPNEDVRVVVVNLENVEYVINERLHAEKPKSRVTYCEQCTNKIEYGNLIHVYTEFFPDCDDGHAVEVNHVFCCKHCANTFLAGKTNAYVPADRFEYNYINWYWEEEENDV